jgi:hypothetical protein
MAVSTERKPQTMDQGTTTYLLARLAEHGEELRSRREPEYIYTAAAIGSFGAVAWGIAALAAANAPTRLPAIVAAVGVFVVALTVVAKSWREHLRHEQQRIQMAAIIARIEQSLVDDVTSLGKAEAVGAPRGFVRRCEALLLSRGGYFWSLIILFAGAAGAIGFCLAVAFSAPVATGPPIH